MGHVVTKGRLVFNEINYLFYFYFFLHNNSGNVQQKVYKEMDLLSVHRVKRVTTNPLLSFEYDC